MARHAWGIDVGDGSLKAVRMKKVRGAFEIVRALEIPYYDPFVTLKRAATPMDRRAGAALLQFAGTAGISRRDRVIVGFPSYRTFEGILRPPRVAAGDLDGAVSFEAAELMSLPVDDLLIRFRTKESRSPDTHRVLALVTVRREVESFRKLLEGIGLDWDGILTPEGALVRLLRLSHSPPGSCAILSPGLRATSLVLVRRTDFWTRTLPVGLPMHPGEGADIALNEMTALADSLVEEIFRFADTAGLGKGVRLRKIFVSGEGARVPSFLNALDSRAPGAVEILGPGENILIDPVKNGLPPADTVASMGKAVGLALAGLTEKEFQIPVLELERRQRILKSLPEITGAALLLLVTALGFTAAEAYRARELEILDKRLESLVPAKLAAESERLGKEVRLEKDTLAYIEDTLRLRRIARVPGRLFSRIEEKSARGTYGDYHFVECDIAAGEEGAGRLEAVVATRIEDEKTVRKELARIFGPLLKDIALTGPYPSGEVSPPENMSPLVHYKVKGGLRRLK